MTRSKNKYLFDFTTDISQIDIPEQLNNPFGSIIPVIAHIAVKEFQEFINVESQEWKHNFKTERGKMFGILVVQKEDNSHVYLATVSGKLSGRTTCDKFIPSVFDVSTDDYFINRGMTELTDMGHKIEITDNQEHKFLLIKKRKLKSIALQQRLFENYVFLNLSGMEENALAIFMKSTQANPPSAAGECTGPKLLNHAFKHGLKPIALAEFWWGNSPKNKERKHKAFYPACKNKCRPILEYMLDDATLFDQENPKNK